MALLHLAGYENDLTTLVDKICAKDILVSYYYVRKHQKEVISALSPYVDKIRTGEMQVILDSGAFSYFNQSHVSRAQLEEYLIEYVSFVRKYHKLFTACVELDVGALIGQDVVEEWRRTIFEPLTSDIRDIYVIYVWHAHQSAKEWEDMCRRYPYCGLGSDNDNSIAKYAERLKVARKYGTKVHGFAITKKEPIKRCMFYSCDSTTWLMGGKFGATFFFTGHDLQRVDGDKNVRNRFKSKYVRLGFDWNKIQNDVRAEINAINGYAWIEYSTWLESKRRAKVYWRTDCAGKIRAAYDNLHHRERLSKALQMMTRWTEQDWLGTIKDAPINCGVAVELKPPKKKVDKQKMVERSKQIVAEGREARAMTESLTRQHAEDHMIDVEIVALSSIDMPKPSGKYVLLIVDDVSSADKCTALVPYEEPEDAEEDSSVLSLDDTALQRKLARNAGVKNPEALDLEDVRRFIPMRPEDGDPDAPQPLSKKERALALKKILSGISQGNTVFCNTCYIGENCQLYQKGSTCAFASKLGLGGRFSVNDLTNEQFKIARQATNRAQFMLMMEQMQGGYADKNVTALLNNAFDLIERTKGIMADANLSRVITTNSSDVAQPEEEAPQEQSILAQIFSLTPDQTAAGDAEFAGYEVDQVSDAEFEEL